MLFPDFKIKDRVIIITGAAGLIGREYVKSLCQAGARVAVAEIDQAKAESVAEDMGNGRAFPVHVDVSDPESVQQMTSRVIEEFGRIDGLVNNAALDPKFDPEHAGEHHLTFENFPLHLWQSALDVNITGMFLCAQAAAPYMKKQKSGVIVNVSSIYGLVGPDQRLYEKDDAAGPPFYKPVTYTVTKSAVIGLTKYLATYFARQPIRVNTLTLGGVYNDHEDDFLKRYTWRAPAGRMARADEYCGALIFLLSDASSYMTGSNLIVDGGWTAW
jgi:2-deoxy-D-gluconate 3-dehydrogenase